MKYSFLMVALMGSKLVFSQESDTETITRKVGSNWLMAPIAG